MIDQLQGLGLPDICIINKQQPTNLRKSSFETQSSFHFVQGLCPQSKAEVLAYLQKILLNQEQQEQVSFFNKSSSISKMTYLSFDIFTQTILVCEILISLEGSHQSQVFVLQNNGQYILPTQQHWQGLYISNILRAIDEESKLASVGRFFNNINLKNNFILGGTIQLLLKLIANNPQIFQDFEKIISTQNFPEIHDVIHYLCWPLDILSSYLERSNQLSLLIEELDKIEDNMVFYLIKSVLYYKIKNYESSLSCLNKLSHIQLKFSLVKYMFGKILIKLEKYQQAFIMLKDTLIKSYENQIVWVTLASIFRKQENYQICLSFLNKAASLQGMKTRKNAWSELQISNYRLLDQDSQITQMSDLDKIYPVINPSLVDKIESFSQLSSHPVLEQLLLKQRVIDKKELKFWYIKAQNFAKNQFSKIDKRKIDYIQYNQLFQNKEELSLLQKEIIRLQNKVGHEKLQKYLQLYFYSPPNSSYSNIDNSNIIDKTHFSIRLKSQNHFQIQQTTMSLDDINSDEDDFNSDEEKKPDFLKLNQTFDFSVQNSKTNSQTPNSITPNSITPKSKTKNNKKILQLQGQKQNCKTYSVIPEDAFESVESERDVIQKFKKNPIQTLQNKETMETINEQSFTEEHQIKIYGILDHFKNISQDQKTEIDNLMRRKKDTLNPQLSDFINCISKTQNILDELFYNNNQRIKTQPLHFPEKAPQKPQFFISQLVESLKNKNSINIQDFYLVSEFDFIDQDEQQAYLQFVKQESIFLFKCSKIAIKLKQFKLAQKLLEKINERVISIQISHLLLKIYKDDHLQLIQQIQKIILDFLECGISKIESIPIWVETHLIRLIKLKGANYVLGLLGTLDNCDSFQLMKKVILQSENLL